MLSKLKNLLIKIREIRCISTIIKDELYSCTLENTQELTLKNIITKCKILSVYDADTVTIAIPFNYNIYKVKCRLTGIDTAEIKTKDLLEKSHGIAGKTYLTDLINDKIIYIECGPWDKYGRLLGTLFLTKKNMDNNISINQNLIDKNYAYKYDGDTKCKFSDWYVPTIIKTTPFS